MKASEYILPTTKEDPADAVVSSHKLMVRAGLIRKSAAGLYHYLPLGFRILKKIESIIREEMNESGALEFTLPILTPSELWEKSGRWERMGKEMFRIKDRHDVSYSLGPTHEESFSSLMKPILKSYKDLPKNVYQIHTKFRDEIRPRFGVIRSREFTMKDAYSFHLDDTSLDETYQTMRKTYRKIFDRCGLNTIPVQADSGSMGGSGSEEFMVVSPIGEETLTLCKNCEFSGNVEKTPIYFSHAPQNESLLQKEKIHTPNLKTIDEVAEFLNISLTGTIKAIYLKADEKWNVIIFLRGDRQLNEVKLNNFLNTLELRPLSEKESNELGLVSGFVGPKEIYENCKIFFDTSINPDEGYIVGANEKDYHFKHFVINRDLKIDFKPKDLSKADSGDPCPNCGAPIHLEKGIEVGHIFKLGQKYSKSFDIKITDKSGKLQLVTMGCYGIGVNRTMATVIEQCNDERGIYWPISIAPFEISMVSITKSEEEQKQIEEIYKHFKKSNLEIFWDDRDLGPGFKLKDSELIGFPIRITFGKNYFTEKKYSILNRKSFEEKEFNFTDINNCIEQLNLLRNELYKSLQSGVK
jgi:prolyl-tRNA synthetase